MIRLLHLWEKEWLIFWVNYQKKLELRKQDYEKGLFLLKQAQQNVRKKYRDKVEVHIKGGFTLIRIPSES